MIHRGMRIRYHAYQHTLRIIMTIAPTKVFYSTKYLYECPLPSSSGLRAKELSTQFEQARLKLDALYFTLLKIKLQESDYCLEEDDCACENAQITQRQVITLLDEIDTYIRDHCEHFLAS
jgi:hypothetical protein